MRCNSSSSSSTDRSAMINHPRAFPRCPLFLFFLLVSFSAVTAGEASKTLVNDATAVSNNDSGSIPIGGRCDETKCRAPIVQQNPLITHMQHPFRGYCWATESNLSDSARKNELCAEGYEARPTTDETTRRPDYVGEEHIEFTCCPENHNDFEVGMVRNCDSSVCRDFDSNCLVRTSSFDILEPMLCEESGRFQHPNLVASEGNYVVYTCCATGDGILTGPRYKNSAFYWIPVPLLVLSTVVATALSVLIASILTSPRARSENFNLYIVFVAIPDWVLNVAVIAIYSLCLAGTKRNLYMWWNYFGGACANANVWINTIIIYELHNMVMRTYRCQRTDPPSVPRICAQCGGASAAVFGLFAVGMFSGNGMTIYVVLGLVFLLNPGSIVYTFWAFYRMRKTGLLSTQGRSRVLALYFGRIVFVFVAFWAPSGLLSAYLGLRGWNPNNGEWPEVVACYLVILQGLASCAMAVTKPDIRQAVEDFMSTVLGTIPARWSGCSLRTATNSEPTASEHTPSTRSSASPDDPSTAETMERGETNGATIDQNPDGKGRAEPKTESRPHPGDSCPKKGTGDPKLIDDATQESFEITSSMLDSTTSTVWDSQRDVETNAKESAGDCYESKQEVRNAPMAVLPTGRVVSRPAVPIVLDDNPSPSAEGDSVA